MHRAVFILGIHILLFSGDAATAAPACLDQSGRSVDWFVILKPPWVTSSSTASFRKGAGYSYADANAPSLTPTNQTLYGASALASTLAPAFAPPASQPPDLGWAFYNDGVPHAAYDFKMGHTKGATIFDSSGGLFLLHSVPDYPNAVGTPYAYPSSGTANGQVFLCVSLNAANLDTVFSQWFYSYPRIYSSKLPPAVSCTYPNLAKYLATAPPPRATAAPYIKQAVVMTSLGMPVRSIAKYPYWGELDLWADGVAPMLGVDLCVQTWQNNGNNLGAFCKRDGRAFNVIDVGGMQFSSDTRWDNVKDHSKWAVSDACTAAADALWVCIGDINRQSGQFSRGGGAMCFQSRPLYESFYSFISPLASNCSGNVSKCAIPLPSGTIPLSAAPGPLGPLYHSHQCPATYNIQHASRYTKVPLSRRRPRLRRRRTMRPHPRRRPRLRRRRTMRRSSSAARCYSTAFCLAAAMITVVIFARARRRASFRTPRSPSSSRASKARRGTRATLMLRILAG